MALALICMGLYLAVAPWIDRAREQRRSIATLSQEIQQLRALLAQRQDLEETLTDLNDRAGKTGYFLEAESPASGGLAMIDSVKSAVRQAGAQWLNAQLLPPIAGQDITLVGIRVHLQGDERALLDMLYQHESDCPMLFVDNLIIRPLQSRRMAEKSEAYQWIDIRFDLQAYMRRD